jgi:gluconolactonase
MEVHMKSNTARVLTLGLLVSFAPVVQAQEAPAADAVATAIPGVIAAGARVELIKAGFEGTEGPIAHPDGGFLFTENRGSRIVKIEPNGTTSVFLEDTKEANGLAFDPMGRLIAVQRAPGFARIAVIYPPGEETVLVDRFDGNPFDRPNDLALAKNGGVYFTDPNPQAVYYVSPTGTVIKAADNITRPNGVLLSPDERTLYVNDSAGEHLLAFDVQPDGTVRNRRNFATYLAVRRTENGIVSGADGLAVDAEGRVYTTSIGGVDVFSPEGRHLGTIPVGIPGGRNPQNLAFAGPDKKTLYIVGRGAAFKVEMLAQGYLGRVK